MTVVTNLENEIRFQWIVDERILFMDVNVEATHKMPVYDQLIVDYLNASSAEAVDLIIRLPKPKQAPPSLKRLTTYKYQKHPRLGYVVMIGLELNPMIRFLITSAAKVSGMKMRTFATLDEGIDFLRTVRQL